MVVKFLRACFQKYINVKDQIKRASLWALTFATIIVLTFVVPYTILKDVASLWGAYTFWTLLTAITIALVCVFMFRWRG